MLLAKVANLAQRGPLSTDFRIISLRRLTGDQASLRGLEASVSRLVDATAVNRPDLEKARHAALADILNDDIARL